MEEAVLVLENWTSFRWGKDCIIWMVYYSDEVVEPWVEAEAASANFSEAQKNDYRKAFVSELRMDEAEPFLVSIYAFGAAPIELRPLAEKMSLINSNGDRLKPISYDRVFDEPTSGIVQGLVFFPKQSNKDFSIELRGSWVFNERTFSFHNQNGDVYDISPIVASAPRQDDLIIIDMPPEPPPAERKVSRSVTAPPPVIIEEKPKIEITPAPTEDQDVDKQVTTIDKQVTQDRSNLYISKEKTLQNFINSWIANDALSMYDMLSDETRKMYSSESFEKEIKRLVDFRRGLLRGYKIDWIGEERAKITTTKKLLIMRTLINRTLGVVRTGREWRIVW
ncbi:MAG: hypothetical protein FWE49_02005 [Synergistaceae bacterium]|nr:hypothetical protein [Synergistaceae bacterium]